MSDIFLQVIIFLLGILMAVLGWNLRSHKADHDKLKEDHQAHKLKVSESYALKSDLNEARRENTESLKRVYDKIEAVDDNLGKEIAAIPERILRLIQRNGKDNG